MTAQQLYRFSILLLCCGAQLRNDSVNTSYGSLSPSLSLFLSLPRPVLQAADSLAHYVPVEQTVELRTRDE